MPPSSHPAPRPEPITDVPLARRLFWENVVREMLTGLSMVRESQPELFDGRIAILTHGGERIPVAEVTPMFACGIPGSTAEKALSIAVECTVFRVRTPGGEVFTLPLGEIRALHALSAELMKEMEREAAARQTNSDEQPQPFGFAAFRSMTGAPQTPAPPEIPAPAPANE